LSLLVLAYPKLKIEDFDRIQDIRKKHDTRYYNAVNPHFTIVFPVFKLEKNKFSEAVSKVAAGINKISFILECAVIVKDSFSDYTDIFLVPDKGYSYIVKLHDKLYSGILKNKLRLDIPFIPHIGVGGYTSPAESKAVADDLNKSNFIIEGIIDKLDIVNYNYPEIETIKEIKLI
jgi:2'-5' RNA ligase